MKKITSLVLSVALLSGCATRGANFVPLVDIPASGKGELTFQHDLEQCQDFAKKMTDAASMAAAGAVAGALLSAFLAPRGYRNYIAGRGAAMGALAAGAEGATGQENAIRKCLAGRGYNVLN